jgi:hypothetical protein
MLTLRFDLSYVLPANSAHVSRWSRICKLQRKHNGGAMEFVEPVLSLMFCTSFISSDPFAEFPSVYDGSNCHHHHHIYGLHVSEIIV